MSEASAKTIVFTLQRHYTDVSMVNIDTVSDVDALIARAPDLVFMGINFVEHEAPLTGKVWLSDILDMHDIRYTGSVKSAHRLGLNKHMAKERIIESGLRTSPFSIVRREDEKSMNENDYSYPLFVKPSNKGGGQGIDENSVVHNFQELESKTSNIHTEHKTDALVEQYLSGREFSVAVIADHESGDLTAMPIELVAAKDTNGDRMLSRDVKASNAEDVIEVTNLLDRSKLTNFAVAIFKALGARDYGRIDIRYDEDEMPHFLEANLIPSLIDGYGSFPKAYELNLGLTYDDMLLQIVGVAMQRTPQEQSLTHTPLA